MKDYKDFINKQLRYAIVGASNNREKYGNRVFRDLKAGEYNVVPVNFKEDLIESFKNYHTIAEIENRPDIVVLVIPPEKTLTVLSEAKDIGITKIWFQPGSESKLAEEYCKKNNINCVIGKCIMVERSLIK